MTNPLIPGITAAEQDVLYQKLNEYNLKKASFKEVGAYLVVLPRADYPRYSLWIYSPLPERQSIFYIFDLSEDIHEALRMASTLCYYSPRPLSLVEYNAKRMQNKGDDIISFGKYHGHYLHEILRIDPGYLTWIAFKFTPRIPKQERFAQIARIYHSVYIDILQRKAKQPPCQLPAVEHAYRMDETVHIASARIAGTYTIGKNKWTRLNYVKFHP